MGKTLGKPVGDVILALDVLYKLDLVKSALAYTNLCNRFSSNAATIITESSDIGLYFSALRYQITKLLPFEYNIQGF